MSTFLIFNDNGNALTNITAHSILGAIETYKKSVFYPTNDRILLRLWDDIGHGFTDYYFPNYGGKHYGDIVHIKEVEYNGSI